MAKLYWIGGLIALGGVLIFGILQYGVSIGRAKCENAQNQAIQVVNNQITQAHNVIDSADLHAIRLRLCKVARGGCKERTDNTPAGM